MFAFLIAGAFMIALEALRDVGIAADHQVLKDGPLLLRGFAQGLKKYLPF